MNIITNPTWSWLPWTVFGVLTLIAALRGYWQGWQAAVYFLVWNVVFLIVGITLMLLAFDPLTNILIKRLPSDGSPNIAEMIKATLVPVKPLIWAIVLIATMLIGWFIATLFYWFFRTKFKSTIRSNKSSGFSNKGIRYLGASIGVISVAPMATFAASISLVASPKRGFNDEIILPLARGFSGLQIENFDKANASIGHILGILDKSASDSLKVLVKLISQVPPTTVTTITNDDTLNSTERATLKKGKKLIEAILNDDRIVTPEFLKAMFKGASIYTLLPPAVFPNNYEPLKDVDKFKVSFKTKGALSEVLSDLNGNNASLLIDSIFKVN